MLLLSWPSCVPTGVCGCLGPWGVLAILLSQSLGHLLKCKFINSTPDLHFLKLSWPFARTPQFENHSPKILLGREYGMWVPRDLNLSLDFTLLSQFLLVPFPFWGFLPVVKCTWCDTQCLSMAVEASWVDGRHYGAGLQRIEVPRTEASPATSRCVW